VKKFGWFALMMSLAMASTVWAQRGQAEASISGKKVSIEYGRPALQGRDMLSRLPVGNSWRMGKDTATTLNSEGNLKFGDTQVKAGSYRLTAKRASEDSWHLVIANDAGSVEVPLKSQASTESVEEFTIKLQDKGGNQGNFWMAWGTLALATDFTVE
jgi:hypothetical protein